MLLARIIPPQHHHSEVQRTSEEWNGLVSQAEELFMKAERLCPGSGQPPVCVCVCVCRVG